MENVLIFHDDQLEELIYKTVNRCLDERCINESVSKSGDGGFYDRDELCELLHIAYPTLWRIEKSGLHLCCVKGNYLSADYKTESIKLRFSEALTFTETGERIPFENLVPYSTDKEVKYETIMKLKNDGLTLDMIAQKVGYKDKSGVSKFLASYEQSKKR